jgi:hypothetical protein
MGDIHVNAAEAVLANSRPGKKLKIVLIILITLFDRCNMLMPGTR